MCQEIKLTKMIRKIKKGKNVNIICPELVNLYECLLDDNVFIAPFVEIGKAKIGKNTRISSHTYICPGVTIGKDCFIGHGVMFTNDKFTEKREEWKLRKTYIGDGVRIGNNATILPVKIGKGSVIGAGSVVTKDIPDFAMAYGNPARVKFRVIKWKKNQNG